MLVYKIVCIFDTTIEVICCIEENNLEDNKNMKLYNK